MRIETRWLRSKLARRIFGLFIVCALLPIGTLAGVSLISVTRELDQSVEARLAESAKAHGMANVDRLTSASSALQLMATLVDQNAVTSRALDTLKGRFLSLVLVTGDGATKLLEGVAIDPPVPSTDEQRHLDQGGIVLTTLTAPGHGPAVLMTTAVAPRDGAPRQLVAFLDLETIWAEQGLGEATGSPWWTGQAGS